MKRVVLAEGHARPAWAGHPNVYDGAILRVEGEPATGDEVDVVDHRGRHVGRGVWHATSPVRVRIHRRDEGPLDDAFVRSRIADAVALRRDVLRLPERTDAWRVVHGDGDHFPGLVADRYGPWVVVQVTTRAAADRREAIGRALLAECGASGVWERSATGFARLEEFHPGGGRLAGETAPELVDVREDGVLWRVGLQEGPKTGHFLDQRDDRREFARLCGGRRVLDVFCGTGGFGVAAAVAGASEVLAVDASGPSVERALENAALNGVGARVTSRIGDAFDVLRALAAEGARFSALSLDPPRFAKSRREVAGALRGYRELNVTALSLLEPGAVFATSSCTGAVTDEEFERMLRDASADAGRRVQVLRRGGQGADHPWAATVPEGRYLKHILARVL